MNSLFAGCPSCGADEACDSPETCKGWIKPGDKYAGAADLWDEYCDLRTDSGHSSSHGLVSWP